VRNHVFVTLSELTVFELLPSNYLFAPRFLPYDGLKVIVFGIFLGNNTLDLLGAIQN
jgi:hypothetical protein